MAATLLRHGHIQGFLDRPGPFVVLGPAVVVIELALAGMLWFRRTRGVAIVVGTGFHLSIAFIMNIHVFSYAMIASYLLFLEPDTVPGALRRLVHRLPGGAARSRARK